MHNKKAEITMQSIVIALMIFSFITLGAVFVMNEGYTNYNIDDTNEIDSESVNFTAFSQNITGRLNDAENTTSRFSPSGSEDDQWKGILGLWNKIEEYRAMIKKTQSLLSTTFSFIPSWILPSLFGILFFILLMRGIFAWFKVKP